MARALREIRYGGTMMLEVFHNPERLRQVIADGCAAKLAEIIAIAEGRDDRPDDE